MARGKPILGCNEVHVWCADLDTASASAHARMLSEEEVQRALRFKTPSDCERFIRARATLRSLLGFYLDLEPASITFSHGRFGKPVIRLSDMNQSLHFNLSYSHGLALFAVSRNFEVGIDIERIQPRLVSLHLAEQFLPPEDVSCLRNLSQQEQTRAFFKAWTRMEARQKLSGNGLEPAARPTTVRRSLSICPKEPADAIKTATCSEENIPVHDGYAAALAVGASAYIVRYLDWPAGHDRCNGQG